MIQLNRLRDFPLPHSLFSPHRCFSLYYSNSISFSNTHNSIIHLFNCVMTMQVQAMVESPASYCQDMFKFHWESIIYSEVESHTTMHVHSQYTCLDHTILLDKYMCIHRCKYIYQSYILHEGCFISREWIMYILLELSLFHCIYGLQLKPFCGKWQYFNRFSC